MESVPTEIAMLDPQGNSHGTGSKSQSPVAHIPNMNIPKLRWDVNNNPYPLENHGVIIRVRIMMILYHVIVIQM